MLSDLGLHPVLRSTAALFLNDRTYERQKDAPVQEIVDFVLGGAGVVLAEDGLLAGSGSALLLSERAGRAQAVEHLKRRLESESEPGIRDAMLSSLRRHAVPEDDLAGWWWTRCEESWEWLNAASRLGVFGAVTRQRETKLSELLSTVGSDSDWVTSRLLVGAYNGSADEVLAEVMREINDGAGEGLRGVDRATSIGRMLHGAAVALSRSSADGAATGSSRTRLRGKKTAKLLARVVTATSELGNRLALDATADQWATRLKRIADLWGDGW